MDKMKPTQDLLAPDRNIKFRQDLLELKEKTLTFFNQMMTFDINFEDDQKNALETVDKLESQIKELREEHLKESNLKKNELKLEDLDLVVETVQDCQKDYIIGGGLTFVGIKSFNSFLIGTDYKDHMLIEKGVQLYLSNLGDSVECLKDIVYIPHQDCYLMIHKDKLYRKDINRKPAYLYLDLRCGYRYGSGFRYSTLNKRLIMPTNNKNLSVFNVWTKKIEIVIKKDDWGYITDFKVFGEFEDRVAALTSSKVLIIYNLNRAQKRGVVAKHKFEMIEDRREGLISVAVCSKNNYVLVELGQGVFPSKCSRMFVFKVNDSSLVLKECFDLFASPTTFKFAIECLGYADAGRHILWVGLPMNQNDSAQVFDYDIEKDELKELVDKRVSFREDRPLKLTFLNGKLYYTGKKGRLMRLFLKSK